MQRPIQAQKNDVAHSNNKHTDDQRKDISYLAGLSKESMEAINWGREGRG